MIYSFEELLKESRCLFESVDNETDVDLVKETHFYHQL